MEPVRMKPDYNEQEFKVDDLPKDEEKDVELLAARFIKDVTAGSFDTLPLRQVTYEDCLMEYGFAKYLGNRQIQCILAKRVNRELARQEHRKIASRKGSLPVLLAKAFENAIQTGHLPAKPSYTKAQALAFINGALGVARDAHCSILPQMAIAHNVLHADSGLIECEKLEAKLLIADDRSLIVVQDGAYRAVRMYQNGKVSNKIMVIDNFSGSGDVQVHAVGCRDIAKANPNANPFEVEYDETQMTAEDAALDFLNDGDDDKPWDAWSIRVLPCAR